VLVVENVFAVDGQTLVVADEPVAVVPDAANPDARRPLVVIPPVSLRFTSSVELFAPGSARPAVVELTAARPNSHGAVQVEAPTGWRVMPPSQSFRLATAGEHARFTFMITAPAQLATGRLGASVAINGARFDNQRVELHYAHIPFQLLQPAATLKAV